MIIWWVELSYSFEDLRGTHAATCDPVVLVIFFFGKVEFGKQVIQMYIYYYFSLVVSLLSLKLLNFFVFFKSKQSEKFW